MAWETERSTGASCRRLIAEAGGRLESTEQIAALAVKPRAAGLARGDGAGLGGEEPRAIVFVEPAGTLAYVTNSSDGTFTGFEVDPATGVLTELRNSTFKAGTSPEVAVFIPSD